MPTQTEQRIKVHAFLQNHFRSMYVFQFTMCVSVGQEHNCTSNIYTMLTVCSERRNSNPEVEESVCFCRNKWERSQADDQQFNFPRPTRSVVSFKTFYSPAYKPGVTCFLTAVMKIRENSIIHVLMSTKISTRSYGNSHPQL